MNESIYLGSFEPLQMDLVPADTSDPWGPTRVAHLPTFTSPSVATTIHRDLSSVGSIQRLFQALLIAKEGHFDTGLWMHKRWWIFCPEGDHAVHQALNVQSAGTETTTDDRPHCLMMQPVFWNQQPENTTIMKWLYGVVPWDWHVTYLLPDNVDDLIWRSCKIRVDKRIHYTLCTSDSLCSPTSRRASRPGVPSVNQCKVFILRDTLYRAFDDQARRRDDRGLLRRSCRSICAVSVHLRNTS